MLALAVLLLLAAAAVTTGVALYSVPSAFIVGGLLTAGWGFLVFAEVKE